MEDGTTETADPSGWSDFAAWVVWLFDSGWGVPVRVILIVVIAVLLRVLLQRVIHRAVERIVVGVKSLYDVSETKQLTAASPVSAVRRVQRTRSLGRVFSNAVTSAILVIAVLLIVWTVFPGVSNAFALVTAAVGAGLGIGAQSVVKDILAGIFLAVEDQAGIGDVATVSLGSTAVTGIIEDVGIRVTQLRDVEGTLWFIPNGQITMVGNRSHGWARAIVDFAVPYETDVERARTVIADTAAALAEDRAWLSRFLERPEVWGIESVSPEAVVLRVVAKTRTSAKDDVQRELLARIKTALSEADVILPPVTAIRIDDRTKAAPTRAPSTRTGPVRTARTKQERAGEASGESSGEAEPESTGDAKTE